jgi:hypothetical protein
LLGLPTRNNRDREWIDPINRATHSLLPCLAATTSTSSSHALPPRRRCSSLGSTATPARATVLALATTTGSVFHRNTVAAACVRDIRVLSRPGDAISIHTVAPTKCAINESITVDAAATSGDVKTTLLPCAYACCKLGHCSSVRAWGVARGEWRV